VRSSPTRPKEVISACLPPTTDHVMMRLSAPVAPLTVFSKGASVPARPQVLFQGELILRVGAEA
jgi:hypothetical protein